MSNINQEDYINQEKNIEEPEESDEINSEVDEQFNKNQKNFFRAQKDIAEGKFNFLYLIEPLEKEVDNENDF